MGTTRFRDPNFTCEITATSPPDVLRPAVINIQRAFARLGEVVPMTSYGIARVDVTDVWNVTAVSGDARNYSSTVTITNSVPYYTLTSLAAGTEAEMDAFLSLVRLFAVILKSCEVSTVAATWG